VLALVAFAFFAQAGAMFVDEHRFHRRRGLARWERLGHPLDTLTVLACYAWLLAEPPTRAHAIVYVALVMGSSLFVTKDEPTHALRCTPGEHWLHALLFVLHPMVLLGAGWLWWTRAPAVLLALAAASTASFGLYQLLYWNVRWRRAR
jgi:hypothetical protein